MPSVEKFYEIDSFEDCLANALPELGKSGEAIAEYELTLRLNPQYPLARFHLARAWEQKGFYDKARANYEMFPEGWKDAAAGIPEIRDDRRFLQKS